MEGLDMILKAVGHDPEGGHWPKVREGWHDGRVGHDPEGGHWPKVREGWLAGSICMARGVDFELKSMHLSTKPAGQQPPETSTAPRAYTTILY